MGKLSVKDKVCILICWALTLTYSATEQNYFVQNRNLTWDEARNHCQVCFKELVTLTPANIQTIAQQLTSDYWVGLRKNFNSTSNSSIPWTRWANGDPLTFQNWYPGWPMLKSPFPKRDCCSCSCTCPEMTTPRTTDYTSLFTTPNVTDISSVTDLNGTDSTELWDSSTQNMTSYTDWTSNTTLNTPEFTSAPPVMTTQTPLEATCLRTPMMSPDEPDTDQNYIEDSCVAMLRFGAWVEKNCSELLPFICYDDSFISPVNLTNVTFRTANLSWQSGPGSISHYCVEVVHGGKNLKENTTSLTYNLVNLTEGTYYFVKVFPVKCGRLLNPQTVDFYTPPNKVENLDVFNVTETSVSLNWTKPVGNVYFYRIYVWDELHKSYKTDTTISGLTPGNLYTFSVCSGLQNNSTWSEASNITSYTKPGKVTNLTVSNNTNSSLLLNWVPPEGNFTGFRVTAVNDNNDILFQVNRTESQVTVTGLPMGTKITLNVTALANGTLEGDNETVVNYTVPGPISKLILTPKFGSISAKWDPPGGNYSCFNVSLQLDGVYVEHSLIDREDHNKMFESLKNAANYTVIVYSVSGTLRSPPVKNSKFTLPVAPTEPSVTADKTHCTFHWKPPANIVTVTYRVMVNSSFWGQNWTDTVVNKNSYTLSGLKSGTKYDFEVRTVAESESNPASITCWTEANKEEISLSMLCSSQQSLLCDNDDTRQNVFDQLTLHFSNLLKNDIVWELELVTKDPGT